MAVYFTTYDQVGWVDLILRVIHPDAGDPICSVLSTSFYVSNGDDPAELAAEGVTLSWLNAFSAALQDAAIQGLTFCTVSGDYGVNSSAYNGATSDGKQHVVYPGSDPWALCCGGTTVGNIVGTSFDEYVWNDATSSFLWGATGGGVSDFFNFLPSYQVDAGNVGDCRLHVSSVAFRHPNRHWKHVNKPFPATLHPGASLNIVLRYNASEKFPRSCDLVITSDDPFEPVKIVEVIATTDWSECCNECCPDCRERRCGKRHCDPCACRKCSDSHEDREHEHGDPRED